MKKAALAIAAAAALARAETIDLAGTERVVEAPFADGGAEMVFTNTSEETATLRFSTEGEILFEGRITGNVKVEKAGAGTVKLYGTQNDYTGGTLVEGGDVAVTNSASLNGPVTVTGGACVTASNGVKLGHWGGNGPQYTVQFLGEGGVCVPDGAYAEIYAWKTKFTNSVFYKSGGGRLQLSGNLNQDGSLGKDGTLHVRGGMFYTSGTDPYGQAMVKSLIKEIVIEPGATLAAAANTPLPDVRMRGGKILNPRLADNYNGWPNPPPNTNTIEHCYSYSPITLNRKVTVEANAAETPSIEAHSVHLSHFDDMTEFDVGEGSELLLKAKVRPGLKNGTGTYRPGGFVKKGAGKVRFAAPLETSGTVFAEEGTLAFSAAAEFPAAMRLECAEGVKVELEDGAAFEGSAGAPGPVFGADVWFDATQVRGRDGESVRRAENRGRAGGSFLKFADCAAPTYNSAGINGKPSLTFDGKQCLYLDAYTNKTDTISVFLVFKWNSWEYDDGKGKWCGPVSFCTVDKETSPAVEDNNVNGNLHLEFQGPGLSKFYWANRGGVTFDSAVLGEGFGVGTPVATYYSRKGGSAECRFWWSAEAEETVRTASGWSSQPLAAEEQRGRELEQAPHRRARGAYRDHAGAFGGGEGEGVGVSEEQVAGGRRGGRGAGA